MSALPSTFGVDRFPDVLPLRDSTGRATGLFSDYGSWFGVVWGTSELLEIRDIARGAIYSIDIGSPLKSARSYADRQEFALLDGRRGRMCVVDPTHLLVEVDGDAAPQVSGIPAHRVMGRPQAWRILIGSNAVESPDPPADIFDTNRERWNGYFAAAFEGMDRPADPTSQTLLARSVTTLMWNWRGPCATIPHSGVIPSPFAYRGYWAWDSWKHAYALAHFAPELAAEQLRAQFHRQQSDGMVPDTVFPDASQDNWRNTKPPLAAWALDFLVQRSNDDAVARELYPKCAAQMRWFRAARRIPGETLYRAGGTDHLTATWDTGWDECARFEGVQLRQHGAWMLMDLWMPDYNSYCLNELHALANLAERLGEDASEWRDEAVLLESAIRRGLWNEAKGCFCDVRASTGASTGIRSAAAWLPVWVGAAAPDQVARVRKLLLSPNHFGTPMPFPTLAASEPAFTPDGYWNGGVWADHAAYAFYILGEAGGPSRDRARDHFAQKDTFFECYSPLDGQPGRGNRPAVSQFSWTAAAGLAVMHGGPRPASEG
jgi:putative isomerase